MIDILLKGLYTLDKLFVLAIGIYIVFWPPFYLVGTVSSSIMSVAAVVSIWAIWANRHDVEFVALSFVCVGVAAYAGFSITAAWEGDESITRSGIACMTLTLLAARAVQLWYNMRLKAALERLFD